MHFHQMLGGLNLDFRDFVLTSSLFVFVIVNFMFFGEINKTVGGF